MKKALLFGIGILLMLAIAVLESQSTKIVPPSSSPQLANVSAATGATTTAPIVAAPVQTAEPSHPVVKVVDGDTLDVLVDGKTTRLRLIGLDTPETVDPRKPVQCFGKAASDKAKELLTGKTVRIEFDVSQGTLDKYGRTLAYVFLSNGTLFNEYMIAEGYGHEYTYNLPYKYQKEFKEAQRRAREEEKGLWADGTCAGDTKKPAAS